MERQGGGRETQTDRQTEKERDWLIDSLLFENGSPILSYKTSLHESRIETEVNTVTKITYKLINSKNQSLVNSLLAWYPVCF